MSMDMIPGVNGYGEDPPSPPRSRRQPPGTRWDGNSSDDGDVEMLPAPRPAAAGKGAAGRGGAAGGGGAAGEVPLQKSLESFFELSDASKAKASKARDKRQEKAKAARQEKAKSMADNPEPPAKDAVISRPRATVSNEQRRLNRGAKTAASKKGFKPRGARAIQPSKTAVKTFKYKKVSRVSVFDRMKQNPGQSLFRTTGGQLACNACNGKIIQHDKKLGVQSHCKSETHIRNMQKSSTSQEEDKGTLRAFCAASDEGGGLYGATLSDHNKLLQIKLVKGCLSAGIPLNALNNPLMKDFFDHVDATLPHSTHLGKHVPFLLTEENAKTMTELGDGNYAVCFDATPYRCECFGIGIRFINQSDGKVVQRVLKLSMLKKSMSARDIVGEIQLVLIEEFGLGLSRCLGFSLDSCAANQLALVSLTEHIFLRSVGILCFSHMFNNVGKQMKFPEVDKFMGKVHTLLSHSPYAKALFLESTGVRPPSTPNHRWGSRFERDHTMAMHWPGVEAFLFAYQTDDEDKGKTIKWLQEQLGLVRPDGKRQRLVLQMQLAVLVDIGKLVTHRHHLPGGGRAAVAQGVRHHLSISF